MQTGRRASWGFWPTLLAGGAILIIIAGCSSGGTSADNPLPGSEELPTATISAPQVISPPDITTPSITERPTGPTAAPIIYEVQSGDTLQGIADMYEGVTLQDIIIANFIDNPNQIQVGDELIIPQSIAP